MRFDTLFLRSENIHLTKDVGMIPYNLHKLFGLDARIVSYKNSKSYDSLSGDVKGLRLKFIKKSLFGRSFDGALYILHEGKKIDILNIYHLNLSSFVYSVFYKIINRKGLLYLKLDLNNKGFEDCFKLSLKSFIKRATIKRADLVSVENRHMYLALREKFGDKIIEVKNGYYLGAAPVDSSDISVKKEKVILTVGNLGSYEKATDTLLKAFIRSAPYHDYVLKLIGPIKEDFIPFKDRILSKNSDIADRIIFTGPVYDKAKLIEEYKKARFFTLPSRSESFGFVLLEAGLLGCYLLPADQCSAASDITHNEKYGRILKTDDVDSIADVFKNICNDTDRDWNKLSKEISSYIESEYNWERIVSELYDKLFPNVEE
ncbi:MAG: glycosyltransferase [Lachnospiraceae bacterium]|nr:glycosyltransferase [Lachnospiraceae bacterium]